VGKTLKFRETPKAYDYEPLLEKEVGPRITTAMDYGSLWLL
jgi:hypothetical protein